MVKLFSIPSLLFFPEEQNPRAPLKYYVGNEAITQYVAGRMQGRFMKSIKKVLPNKSFIDTKISNKKCKAEDLVSLILKFLKKQADDYLNADIKTAVIGRPVFAVKNRQALILPEWEENLYRYTTGIIETRGHKMLAIGGMPDHIHIFRRFRGRDWPENNV